MKPFATARNVPLTDPAGIVSEAGMLRFAELELSPTVPPPDPVRTTVQVLEAFGPRLVGLHPSEDTRAGATRLTVAFAELLL